MHEIVFPCLNLQKVLDKISFLWYTISNVR